MIAKNLISQIRKAKGPIYIETYNFNDTFWVQAVKSDLIKMIQDSFDSDFETGFELDKNGYFSKDYTTV